MLLNAFLLGLLIVPGLVTAASPSGSVNRIRGKEVPRYGIPTSSPPATKASPTAIVDLRQAISNRNIESISKGTSFHIPPNHRESVFQDLGRPHNEPFLDVVLTNPRASAVVDHGRVLHFAIPRDDRTGIPQKVAKMAPSILGIFKLITTASSYRLMDVVKILLGRRDDTQRELAKCQAPPPTCEQPRQDLLGLIPELGNARHYDELSLLFEMIPKDVLEHVSQMNTKGSDMPICFGKPDKLPPCGAYSAHSTFLHPIQRNQNHSMKGAPSQCTLSKTRLERLV